MDSSARPFRGFEELEDWLQGDDENDHHGGDDNLFNYLFETTGELEVNLTMADLGCLLSGEAAPGPIAGEVREALTSEPEGWTAVTSDSDESFTQLAGQLRDDSTLCMADLRSGEGVLAAHIADESKGRSTVDDSQENAVPVIDLGGFKSGDPPALVQMARKLRAAAEEWGIFQVVNHGVPSEVTHKMGVAFDNFFKLPRNVKERAKTVGPSPKLFGYTGLCTPAGGGSWSSQKTVIIKESLADSRAASLEELTEKNWPEGNPDFR